MTEDMPELTQQYLKQALKAFKKRLKLTRLDEESGLGGGPFSSGRASGIVAIQPPNQYPHEVWDKLVEQGRLRRVAAGLYALTQDPNAPIGD
ncbi:MAG: hypothetical protein NTZ17_05940 [Phycisphaerae bacterium]|nr:hypothetical protein [Phycisphaerae bacterium]